MSSENELERQFSENVDRLLASQAVEADPTMGDDMRAAQSFAQRMIALRSLPSPQFKAQLKARLLNKLNAQVAKQPSWHERVWPRRVGWQLATVLAILVIVIGVVGSRILFQPSTPVHVSGVDLGISGNTDKPVYQLGEQVRIHVTMKNVTPEPFKMEQFPPILSLMHADTRQPVYTFTAGKTVRTLAPNQSVTFQVTWDQRDDKGRMVPSGTYYLELEDLDYQGQSLKLNFTQAVQFDIREKA